MNTLATRVTGTGATLLLLHGIGGSATAWGKLTERLAPDFRCLAPDLPGYGESAAPAAIGLEPLVDSIASLLDNAPAYVVGVSFGALLALALAHRHPRLVRRMVLADATLGRGYLDPASKAQWLANRQLLADNLASVSQARAAEIASASAPTDIIEEIATHMRRARPEGYMNVAQTIAAVDARPWLPEITTPTLVLYGEDDAVTGAEMSSTLVNTLPTAQLGVLPNCGHAPQIEQADAFAVWIKAFFH